MLFSKRDQAADWCAGCLGTLVRSALCRQLEPALIGHRPDVWNINPGAKDLDGVDNCPNK